MMGFLSTLTSISSTQWLSYVGSFTLAAPLAAAPFDLKSHQDRSLVSRYLLALLAPAVVAAVMQVTWPFFQNNTVSPYLLAVIFCAWYGGLGPGLLSVFVSFLLTDFFFIEPYFALWFSKKVDLVRLLIFAVVGPFISVMSELMHRERRRAEINLESARQAVEARRQSDANYRALFEGSALPMWVYDIETLAFLAVNEAAVHHYGYSREEFLALTIVDIRPPEDVPAFRAALAEAAAGFSAVANTWRHAKKDDSVIEVETTHNPLDFAGRPARQVLANDVTKRRQAEEALRQSYWQLQNILDSLFAFVGVFSTEGVVLEANRAPLEAAALKREEVLGKFFPETYWWSYSAAVQDRLRAALQRAAQGEVVRYDEVIRVANDQRVTIDVVFGPLRDAEGKISEIVGSAVDITERKRAEDALKATSKQLRALSARLQSAKEEEGTRIARELHDELGSALTSLRWSLDEIDSLLSTTPSKVATDKLREKIATMTTLVEGTLQTVRRISSELRPSILDELGLGAAIQWQADQFQAQTGIICDCDSSPENVELTQEQSTAVFRIFQEALTNVLRHSQATRVDIKIDKENGYFVLSISDNGKGITGREKSAHQSLGVLGMRERAHLIGGEIDIKGIEGKGTLVTVRVPISGGDKVLKMTR